MTVLITIIAFAIAIGVLVVIHESGHYFAARSVGVHVDRFSIGFGPALFKRRSADGTEWVIAAIPLGGYVKFLDEKVEEVPLHLLDKVFDKASVWARIWIVSAGPLANFVLAALIYTGLNMTGVQELAADIAMPTPASVAGRAGLTQAGRVVTVDGQPVQTFSELRLAVVNTLGRAEPVVLQVQHANQRNSTVELNVQGLGKDDLNDTISRDLGINPALPKAVIARVLEGSAAQQAGLQSGDVVLATNGAPVDSAQGFIGVVQTQAEREMLVTIEREGTSLQVKLTPRAQIDEKTGKSVGKIGAEIGAKRAMVTRPLNPVSASIRAVEQVFDTGWLSLKMMGKMLIGQLSLKNLSGPVTIADYAGQSARAGFSTYVLFIALVSVSIGVLNLLPIPVLDGGLLLYYLGEIIRGQPLPEKVLNVTHRIGVGVVICMMSLALYNDLMRYFQ